MIRDRGAIKWTAMMLPEHVKQLREFDLEQNEKVKPELDEQQLELIEETICEAMAEDLFLCITYFKYHDFHLLIGKVHYLDDSKREWRIVDYHNELHKINLDDLVDVKFH
ncbi:YolD-like family protein [Fictibacillus sp. KU28468]|uniref:YolD-like family protein n=1 Tax=Fictibacillus sp. KU28468 TaxID=2991053 RepID=UPI00223DEBE0|nr:YolD-like family protein [Fictibacillus sp. KU28468]UZJ78754.1 YolD-like family protein [Fictibacillus sp. KU28468]